MQRGNLNRNMKKSGGLQGVASKKRQAQTANPKKDPSRKSQQLRSLKSFIKNQLRLRKWKYKDLAEKMNVSEVTIKRWLSSADISVKDLIEMGELLNFEPFAMIQGDFASRKQFKYYNKAQTEYLLKNPLTFLMFIKMAYGTDLLQVQEMFGWDEAKVRKELRQLDKLKMIELWPGDEIRLKILGPYRIPPGSDMAKKYFGLMKDHLLEHFKTQMPDRIEQPTFPSCRLFRPSEMYLTEASAYQLGQELVGVLSKYARLGVIEAQNKEKVHPTSLLIAVDHFDLWEKVTRM